MNRKVACSPGFDQRQPGNKMTFAGVHGAEDRRDLIAYIATQTRTPPAA